MSNGFYTPEGRKMHDTYLRNPSKLVEDMFGVKLKWWQKLKIMFFSTKQVQDAIVKYIWS